MIERWRKWRRRRPHALGRVARSLLALAALLFAGLVVGSDVRERLRRAEAALADGRVAGRASVSGGGAGSGARAGPVRSAAGTGPRTPLAPARRPPEDSRCTAPRGPSRPDGRGAPRPGGSRPPPLRDGDPSRGGRALARPGATAPRDLGGPRPDPDPTGGPGAGGRAAAPVGPARAGGSPGRTSASSWRRTAIARRGGATRCASLRKPRRGSAPVPRLERERQSYAEALGLTDLARASARRRARIVPATAWEHDALGRSLLDAGELEAAAREFKHAADLRPEDLWVHFDRGVCAYRLRRFAAAAAAFDVCVACARRRPSAITTGPGRTRPWGRPKRALRDYDHALRLDPHLAPAALNRGVLLFRERRHPEAIADFRRALAGAHAPGRSTTTSPSPIWRRATTPPQGPTSIAPSSSSPMSATSTTSIAASGANTRVADAELAQGPPCGPSRASLHGVPVASEQLWKVFHNEDGLESAEPDLQSTRQEARRRPVGALDYGKCFTTGGRRADSSGERGVVART